MNRHLAPYLHFCLSKLFTPIGFGSAKPLCNFFSSPKQISIVFLLLLFLIHWTQVPKRYNSKEALTKRTNLNCQRMDLCGSACPTEPNTRRKALFLLCWVQSSLTPFPRNQIFIAFPLDLIQFFLVIQNQKCPTRKRLSIICEVGGGVESGGRKRGKAEHLSFTILFPTPCNRQEA